MSTFAVRKGEWVGVALTVAAIAGLSLLATHVQDLKAFYMQQAPTPVVYLSGGMAVDLGDRHAFVFGVDKCPTDSYAFAPGHDHDCVRLDRPSLQVQVSDHLDGPRTSEQWMVNTDADKMWITRPNGLVVSEIH